MHLYYVLCHNVIMTRWLHGQCSVLYIRHFSIHPQQSPPPPPSGPVVTCIHRQRNTYNLLLVLHTLYFLRATTTQTTLVIKTMNAWLLILSVVSLNICLHLEGEYYDFHQLNSMKKCNKVAIYINSSCFLEKNY